MFAHMVSDCAFCLLIYNQWKIRTSWNIWLKMAERLFWIRDPFNGRFYFVIRWWWWWGLRTSGTDSVAFQTGWEGSTCILFVLYHTFVAFEACSHRTTPSQTLTWRVKWVCNPFSLSHCPSKRSKVSPVNVTVTVTESFGVNRPLTSRFNSRMVPDQSAYPYSGSWLNLLINETNFSYSWYFVNHCSQIIFEKFVSYIEVSTIYTRIATVREKTNIKFWLVLSILQFWLNKDSRRQIINPGLFHNFHNFPASKFTAQKSTCERIFFCCPFIW